MKYFCIAFSSGSEAVVLSTKLVVLHSNLPASHFGGEPRFVRVPQGNV